MVKFRKGIFKTKKVESWSEYCFTFLGNILPFLKINEDIKMDKLNIDLSALEEFSAYLEAHKDIQDALKVSAAAHNSNNDAEA
ncbi:hypothetical protein DBL04_13850 [Acinetobacter seifertii]|nr:hypothetical protein DBL04_13850 [Acinetobacter seifertii]